MGILKKAKGKTEEAAKKTASAAEKVGKEGAELGKKGAKKVESTAKKAKKETLSKSLTARLNPLVLFGPIFLRRVCSNEGFFSKFQ